MRKKRVVGLMSGTSLDGIDAALVEIDGWGAETEARLIAFETTPFDRERVHSLLSGDTRAICEGNFWLGEKFAEAARRIINEAGPADLIGSHGQTLWHQPPSAGGSSTLQMGEPALIAARTGLVTVGDFRVADVAEGGEGAPLVPWTDWVLHKRAGRVRALQNIGGIANVTAVTEKLEEMIAFDNGPGNMMIDALAPLASQGADDIDRDGRWSQKGRVQEDLLARLLDDDYLKMPPPKSTGRERYGKATTLQWASANKDRSPVDLLGTLVAFTARAIADSYRFLPRVDEVLVSGGGAHNQTLMRALQTLLPNVSAFPQSDAKEAIAFAVLAVQTIHAVPANVVRVTGARRPIVLGKICYP
jgi:anhydro-N-acetylmuramic acid kinase